MSANGEQRGDQLDLWGGESRRGRIPTARPGEERRVAARGYERVAGIDEAGRGPLAGPVVAAAVILPRGLKIRGLNDSKQLTPDQRDDIYNKISQSALGVGVGIIGAEEIDRINILEATRKAALIAVEELRKAGMPPDYLLTDALRLPEAGIPFGAFAKADEKIPCVSAASVVAKVTRDRMLCELDGEFPGFGFARHKGYGVRLHLEALQRLGPTTIHRLTFRGVAGEEEDCRHSVSFARLEAEARELAEKDAAGWQNWYKKVESLAAKLPERELKKLKKYSQDGQDKQDSHGCVD